MKVAKPVFVCQECGAQAPKWMGRCADCGAWNSLIEERAIDPAAGAAAAVYAARKGIRTGILAERFGGQVLDTMGIENFISVQETEGPKLATALGRKPSLKLGEILDDIIRWKRSQRDGGGVAS